MPLYWRFAWRVLARVMLKLTHTVWNIMQECGNPFRARERSTRGEARVGIPLECIIHNKLIAAAGVV